MVVEHPVTTCPDCGNRLGGVQVGRTRQVVDLPPPVAVVVTEHRVQRRWNSRGASRQRAPLDLRGQAFGHGRLLLDVQALGAQFVTTAGHPCRALAWRLWHFQQELLTGVVQPAVPPDNNAAERAIRPLVVARKISGGTGSPCGCATRMGLYTLDATWTAHGHNPLAEFRRLLQSPFP